MNILIHLLFIQGVILKHAFIHALYAHLMNLGCHEPKGVSFGKCDNVTIKSIKRPWIVPRNQYSNTKLPYNINI